MDLDHQVIEFWNYIRETHLSDRNALLCIVLWWFLVVVLGGYQCSRQFIAACAGSKWLIMF